MHIAGFLFSGRPAWATSTRKAVMVLIAIRCGIGRLLAAPACSLQTIGRATVTEPFLFAYSSSSSGARHLP